MKKALLSLTAGLFLSITASANTFYVSTTGADTNPGSLAQPWRTIQKAVDTIAAGDTIIVKPGSYAGCRIGKSGTAGGVCTLMAETVGTVIINSLSPANRHQSLIEIENFTSTIRYWVIDGFECASAQRYGIDLRDTDFITVQNCKAHNSGLTGIFLAFCYHPLIQNNESYSNGEHGVYQSNSGDYPTIIGNKLHHNFAAGLHMNGDRNFTPGDGIISFATVEKNMIWENGAGGGSGINCDGVSDSIFRNNLLYNNHASGISLYAIDASEGSSRNRVYNNTIVMPSNGRWCVNIPPSSSGQPNPVGNDIRNNILYTSHTFRGSVSIYSASAAGFSSDYNVVVNRFSTDDGNTNRSLVSWQALGYDQHSIIATPDQLFTNAAANDYTLKSGSPAIDAGVTLSGDVSEDITGAARPRGLQFDIGCYEAAPALGPSAPVADFMGSPLAGVTPLGVGFTDLSSGNATAWSWDFGDGGASTEQNPRHTYQNAGSFTVRLTASNAGGQNTNTKAAYVAVSAPVSPPVAGFVADRTSGTAPLTVQFTDQSTGASSWSWNFGDGATSTDANPIHIYGSGGSFTVTLTVSNAAGPNTKTRVGYITVAAPPLAPGADFTANPLSGSVPLNVQFSDQSTGSPSAWAWSFGDGGTSSQRNPSHTYTAAGNFTVSLTVSNSSGQTMQSRFGYITVAPATAVDYFCQSLVIDAGKLIDGDHDSVHAADDLYLRIKASQLDGLFSDVITYAFDTRLASLSSLAVTLESRSKTAPVRQQVFLFNYSSGQWEQIDDREITSKKELSTTVGATNPSRYLSAAGEVRCRIQTGDVAGGRWKHFVNLVKITAAP